MAIDEPAGKPLRECRMVEVRLTLRAEGDLHLRRTQGLAALLLTKQRHTQLPDTRS